MLARHELQSLTLLKFKSLVTGINWKIILELLWPNTIFMAVVTERISSKTNSGRLTVERFYADKIGKYFSSHHNVKSTCTPLI